MFTLEVFDKRAFELVAAVSFVSTTNSLNHEASVDIALSNKLEDMMDFQSFVESDVFHPEISNGQNSVVPDEMIQQMHFQTLCAMFNFIVAFVNHALPWARRNL